MPLTLTLDLSTPDGSIAIHDSEVLISESALGGTFKHSEMLITILDQTLKSRGLAIAQFSRFLCPYGPGSFTGLRIAMATLKAFALVTGGKIEAMSSSEARALGWAVGRTINPGDRLIVLTHVGTQRVVQARFHWDEARGMVFDSEESLEVATWKRPEGDQYTILTDRENQPMEAIHFVSHARYFFPACPQSSTVKSACTPDEYVNLNPIYFGSRN